MPKRLIMDLDGTITHEDPSLSYEERRPNLAVVERMREYRHDGFEIVIASARNMRTFEGAIGKINAVTLPIILAWLKEHDIPFDEVIVGKPWCGFQGFYVDDRAIRPSEFVDLSYDEVTALIELGSAT